MATRKVAQELPSKLCARCGKKFDDDMMFVTCPTCRIPLPADGDYSGCRYWQYAAPDPRVTKLIRTSSGAMIDGTESMRGAS